MRWMLLTLAVGSAGGTAWLFHARGSFADYSESQLDELEQGYRLAAEQPTPGAQQLAFSHELTKHLW